MSKALYIETESAPGTAVDLSQYWKPQLFENTRVIIPLPSRPQRDNLLALHATLQDALSWLDDAPEFNDYRRKVISCLRSTEKVLGLEQSRQERHR